MTPVGLHREGGRRLSRYRFRHILIQRYLYHQLDEMERAYQHEAGGCAGDPLRRASWRGCHQPGLSLCGRRQY
ncbi:hypothetical protein KFU94_01340 [Chloroflexi bacterium TSY]|nr:hypothetical protein [Chloroflexi bacterium TSY]